MREYFTYGSVRGAASDGGPYRVRVPADLRRVFGKTIPTLRAFAFSALKCSPGNREQCAGRRISDFLIDQCFP